MDEGRGCYRRLVKLPYGAVPENWRSKILIDLDSSIALKNARARAIQGHDGYPTEPSFQRRVLVTLQDNAYLWPATNDLGVYGIKEICIKVALKTQAALAFFYYVRTQRRQKLNTLTTQRPLRV